MSIFTQKLPFQLFIKIAILCIKEEYLHSRYVFFFGCGLYYIFGDYIIFVNYSCILYAKIDETHTKIDETPTKIGYHDYLIIITLTKKLHNSIYMQYKPQQKKNTYLECKYL